MSKNPWITKVLNCGVILRYIGPFSPTNDIDAWVEEKRGRENREKKNFTQIEGRKPVRWIPDERIWVDASWSVSGQCASPVGLQLENKL